MDQLGTFLRQAVYLLPQRHELRESLALALWEKAVGESLAKRTKPLRLHRTTLIVTTSSEPWKRELHHLRTEIARKLNECAGFRLIHDLEFRVDLNFVIPPAATNQVSPETKIEPLDLPTEAILDQTLRNSFRAAASSYLNRGR
jgi:hypothetical protein